MNKKWLASLHKNPLYKARQLQAISYSSLFLNFILIIVLLLFLFQ